MRRIMNKGKQEGKGKKKEKAINRMRWALFLEGEVEGKAFNELVIDFTVSIFIKRNESVEKESSKKEKKKFYFVLGIIEN